MYPPNANPLSDSFGNLIIERMRTKNKSNAIKSKPNAINVA